MTSPLNLPQTKLEYALTSLALSPLLQNPKKILCLADGPGHHARQALSLSTTPISIDVIDLDASQLETGEEIEAAEGRDKIRWILADVWKPLNEQAIVPSLPKNAYDVVMAMWVFDHAGTTEEWETLWRNIAMYLKPGGRLIGCRLANPWSKAARSGKYGGRIVDIEDIPRGGVKCQFELETDPPVVSETLSVEESLMGDKDFPRSLGIREMQSLKAKETELVKADPEFWKEFVEDPYFVVFTARKSSF